MKLVHNVRAITPFGIVQDAALIVADGKILEVREGRYGNLAEQAEEIIDGKGLYASAGFIDIHVHGGGGYETIDGDVDGIMKMCRAHVLSGTTSILPATVAAPIDMLNDAIDAVREAQAKYRDSNILGIYLEGPYLSMAQAGGQSVKDIHAPRPSEYMPLLDRWDGIRMMSVAPEIEGAMALGRELKKRGIVASIGHSNADFQQVLTAIENGYSDVTHLYSGCSTVTRRNAYRIAGVVEAGLVLDELSVQVIGDGKHLPTPLLQLIYRCKGADKIALITDALGLAGCDCEEGTIYEQKNGVKVLFEDGVLKLPDRQCFAGSICTSNKLVRNMRDLGGASLIDAVKMVTSTPAKIIGVEKSKGKLEAGYDADIVLFDEMIDVQFVMVNGKIVKGGLSCCRMNKPLMK